MGNDLTFVTSHDGTRIAIERTGDGPPVILVVGAFNDRSTGTPLASALRSQFTVYTYDRRGRGDSGDTAPYSVDREIEDLGAVIAEAGGAAAVFGYSSGAALALKAASGNPAITKLAMYDLPLDQRPRWSEDHAARLAELIAADRRGEAVEYFQANLIGMPEAVIAQLRNAPFRPALEAIAHTLVYEAAVLGDGAVPPGLAESVTIPVLAVAAEQNVPFIHETARSLAASLPDGRAVILEGQTHDIDPEALEPGLADFFLGTGPRPRER